MARHAALEAAIAEDCDEPERYLIYGDWLQARGDVRGTFIALHDAIRRDPTNAAAKADAAELLETQGRELLGGLHMRNDVELTWFQGFIRTARHNGGGRARDVLGALLDTPAGAFVQAITIDHLDESDLVEELLARAKRPATLAHLAIGKPSQWKIPSRLYEAFPRLARDPHVEWADAVKAATRPRLAIQLDLATLPELHPRPGFEVDRKTVLKGIKLEIAKKEPTGMLHALPRAVTRDSLDLFAREVAKQALTPNLDARWGFDAIGSLGGPRCVEYLGANIGEWGPLRVDKAFEHLRRIDSDASVTELVRLSGDPALDPERRRAAAEHLELVALHRNSDSLWQLIARSCPRVLARSDAERFVPVQRDWLADLMIAGHRLAQDDFFAHVASHPIRRPLVTNLVWLESVRGEHRSHFVVDAYGGARGIDGSPHLLDREATIGVVHPLELTAAQLRDWKAAATRLGLVPPFPQLDRPTFALTPEEGRASQLDRYATRRSTPRAGQARILRLLTARGYLPCVGRHASDCFVRSFARDNLTPHVIVRSGAIETVLLRNTARWQDRRLDTHHRVTLSELLYDLEHATS